MFENIEKALAIMLLEIRVKLDGKDEQGKKGKKICLDETMVKKPCLRTSAYQNIFEESRLKDKEGIPT